MPRKNSWEYKVNELIGQYEAELQNANYTPSIKQLKSTGKSIGILVPETNHIVFIANADHKSLKSNILQSIQNQAQQNGLESSLIFYLHETTPLAEQVYNRVRDTHEYPRSNALSLYTPQERQRAFSFTDREKIVPLFHRLANERRNGRMVQQSAYNLQRGTMETIVMQQMLKDYSHLSEPRDQWWKYEGEHGQPYKGRFLDVRHVTIPSIVDLVDRKKHNQIINGQNLPPVTPGQLPLFR